MSSFNRFGHVPMKTLLTGTILLAGDDQTVQLALSGEEFRDYRNPPMVQNIKMLMIDASNILYRLHKHAPSRVSIPSGVRKQDIRRLPTEMETFFRDTNIRYNKLFSKAYQTRSRTNHRKNVASKTNIWNISMIGFKRTDIRGTSPFCITTYHPSGGARYVKESMIWSRSKASYYE